MSRAEVEAVAKYLNDHEGYDYQVFVVSGMKGGVLWSFTRSKVLLIDETIRAERLESIRHDYLPIRKLHPVQRSAQYGCKCIECKGWRDVDRRLHERRVKEAKDLLATEGDA